MIKRFLCIGIFILLQACSGSDGTEMEMDLPPSNLNVIVDIVGQSNEKPYGDGGGRVNFMFQATNASLYKVRIEDKVEELTSNTLSHTFSKEGTHSYSIIVSAYNGGQFVSKTVNITIYVEELTGLIWSDEFNEGSLDLSKWNYETGTGINGNWGTGQLDRATDRVENVSFANGIADADGGCLVITTRKETYQDRDYTSGRINTKDKGAWGPGHRIVARVFPAGVKHQGQGFAFWMMPQEKPVTVDEIMWPQGGEVDIMEYVGSIPYHNLGTVHYAWEWQNNEYQEWNHGHLGGYYSYGTQQTPIPEEPGYGSYPPLNNDPNAGSSGFHEYGLDWYDDRIEFFVDGHVYHIHYLNDGGGFVVDGQDQKSVNQLNGRRVTVSEYSNHFDEWHPFENNMFLILSAGVGGSDHTYGGPIVPEAQFPASVYIDWVRVYRL
ncbi:glycoside hydrolase family 16 protein [Flagellimonas amoyensis]|uniref:glycoside hydrolase family 16 protein n=1 Tax=Flagellimonas amoyensis TaxID=2169401 RepID=UPI0019024CAB|nr:glycoside hydrolase family 16 protein [Allomuricauda amoyensis]